MKNVLKCITAIHIVEILETYVLAIFATLKRNLQPMVFKMKLVLYCTY